MRLEAHDVLIVANPPPSFGGRYFILVKLVTECGRTGWGEVYAASIGPEAMRAVIADVFQRHMAGENPEAVERMFRRAYSAGFSQRPDPTVMGAFSGLEMACWDLVGQARERPIAALLGGQLHARLRAYTYLYPNPDEDAAAFYASPARAGEAAAACVAEGWTAVKFDPAGPYTVFGGHQPLPEDLTRAAALSMAVREAVGDGAELLFGTHGQFTPSGAVRMAHAIAPARPLWFEEPVPPDNAVAMASVAAASPVPLAAGERLTTRAEFWPLLQAGALGVCQPALGRVGGIWEARKLAALAETAGASVAPHLYAGPVARAASVQLAAALPNLLLVETVETPFHAALTGGAHPLRAGYITVTDAPGLGIEVDEALARASPWTGARLHLEMQDSAHVPGPNVWTGG